MPPWRVALISVKTAGPLLDTMIPEPSLLILMNVDVDNQNEAMRISKDSVNNTSEAAISLSSESEQDPAVVPGNVTRHPRRHGTAGLWKFLGVTANMYGCRKPRRSRRLSHSTHHAARSGGAEMAGVAVLDSGPLLRWPWRVSFFYLRKKRYCGAIVRM
jgi:hypothetical protein